MIHFGTLFFLKGYFIRFMPIYLTKTYNNQTSSDYLTKKRNITEIGSATYISPDFIIFST